jgi:hypothetical protein
VIPLATRLARALSGWLLAADEVTFYLHPDRCKLDNLVLYC